MGHEAVPSTPLAKGDAGFQAPVGPFLGASAPVPWRDPPMVLMHTKHQDRDMVLTTPSPDDNCPQALLQVLVVDDQAAVREGLIQLLGTAEEPWGLIQSAGTLAEARRCIEARHPDIVLLDVDLAGDDGLALLPELAPRALVLVLSSHADSATRSRAARLGAAGLMDKSEPAAQVLAQVRRLVAPHLRGDKTPIRVGT
jgi:CheY-like chemotaxis protein